MPLLFCIGIQGALEDIAATLTPGFFFDDVCALCRPERVKVIHDMLTESVARREAVSTRAEREWNRG